MSWKESKEAQRAALAKWKAGRVVHQSVKSAGKGRYIHGTYYAGRRRFKRERAERKRNRRQMFRLAKRLRRMADASAAAAASFGRVRASAEEVAASLANLRAELVARGA